MKLIEVIFTGVVSKPPSKIPKTREAGPTKIIAIQQQ